MTWCIDLWYDLPLRISVWSAQDEEGESRLFRKQTNYTIVPLSLRMYMAYDYTGKSSVNIMFPPFSKDSTSNLINLLNIRPSLNADPDPFGIHLLYLSAAVSDWKQVFRDVTRELVHYASSFSDSIIYYLDIVYFCRKIKFYLP